MERMASTTDKYSQIQNCPERAGGGLNASVPLDELIASASELTQQNFSAPDGRRRMLLYAPIYLSSHCVNRCRYCGFNNSRQIERKHLALDEALVESDILL